MESKYEIIFKDGLNVSRRAVEHAIDIARNVCVAFANRLFTGNTLTQFLTVMDDVVSNGIDSMFACEEGPRDLSDDQAVADAVINRFFEQFAELLDDEDDVEDIDYKVDGENSEFDAYIRGEYDENDVCNYLEDKLYYSDDKESADDTMVIGAQEIPISLVELLISRESSGSGAEVARRHIADLATSIGKAVRSGTDYDEQININMLENDEDRYIAMAFILTYQAMVNDPFKKDNIIRYCNLVDNVKSVGNQQMTGTLLAEHMNQLFGNPHYFYIDWESMLEVITDSNGKINISFDVDHSLLKVTTSEAEPYVTPDPDGSLPVYLEKVEYIGETPKFVMTIKRYNERETHSKENPYWLEDKSYQMNMDMDVDMEVAVRAILYIKHLYVLTRNGDASAWDEIEKCSRFDNKQWEELLKDKPVLFDEPAD